MKTMTQIANGVVNKLKPEMLDWGFRFLVEDEIDALRVGYVYRKSLYGYKVEFAEGVQKYSVTIWNSKAQEMGCDV